MVASHACAPERSVRRLSLPDEAAWPLANVAFVAFDAEAYSVPPPAPTPADADADAPIDDLIVLCVNALRVMARLPCVCAKNKQEIFWFAPSGWVTGRWYVRSSREFVF